MKKIIFALCFIFLGNLSLARAEGCLDDKKVDALLKDFRFGSRILSNGKMAYPQLERCDSSVLTYKALAALIFLKELKIDKMKRDELNQGILNDGPYEFFRKRIKDIIFESSESPGCDGITGAYVMNQEKNTTHICPLLGEGFSTYSFANALIHESRHIDGYPHVYCEMEGLRGYACDPSYAYKGSYGIGAELSIKVARSESLPESLRMAARADAIQSLLSRFISAPLNIKKGVYLQETTGFLTFFDGKRESSPFRLPETKNSVLTLRGNMPTVFDLDLGEVKSYFYSPLFRDTEGVFAADFRKMSSQDRSDILDVRYVSGAACFLTSQTLSCDTPSSTKVVPLKRFRPSHFASMQGRLAIVSEVNEAYALPTNLDELKDSQEFAFQKIQNPNVFLESVQLGSTKGLGLTETGEVKAFSKWLLPAQPYESLKGRTFKRILGPVKSSPRLEEI